MEEYSMKITDFCYPLTCVLLLTLLTGCNSYKPIQTLPTEIITPENTEPYAQFFGTTTILVAEGKNSVLIDGFFTRRSFTNHFFIQRMNPDYGQINEALAKIESDKIDAILVSHSHFDHALDAGAVAKITNAKLYGSQNTIDFTCDYLNREAIVTGERIKIGENFYVTSYESPHAKKSNAIQNIESFVTWSVSGSDFIKADKVYSFYIELSDLSVLVIPSAGLDPDRLPDDLKADVVFLGIGLLSRQQPKELAGESNEPPSYIEKYWRDAVVATEASLVIPVHYDDFRKPIVNEIPVTPNMLDDIEWTMQQLYFLAYKTNLSGQKVRMAFPPAVKPFHLKQK